MAVAALEVQGLAFALADTLLLDGIDLRVGSGEVCCLLGPNGAGKTTLLRCVLGMQARTGGTVRIAGRALETLADAERARQVAYVPQQGVTGFPYTVADIVVMGRTPHLPALRTPSAADRAMSLRTLHTLGIGHLADRPFNAVSGGERQLALIARALVQDTPLVVLDEPTASLDFGNQARILQVVRTLAGEGRTVVLTTHSPDHALLCATQVALLRDGRILADGPPAAVLTAERLTRLYDVPVRVAAIPPDPGCTRPRQVCVPTLTVDDLRHQEANP